MPLGSVLTWIGGGALMGSTLGTAARTLGTGAGSGCGFSTVVGFVPAFGVVRCLLLKEGCQSGEGFPLGVFLGFVLLECAS